MTEIINMVNVDIEKKVIAIVMFGPALPSSGMRPAEYYQVTIDPDQLSPSGQYIRFGMNQGDEINGWQLVSALTVCEILQEWTEIGSLKDTDEKSVYPAIPVTIRKIE